MVSVSFISSFCRMGSHRALSMCLAGVGTLLGTHLCIQFSRIPASWSMDGKILLSLGKLREEARDYTVAIRSGAGVGSSPHHR